MITLLVPHYSRGCYGRGISAALEYCFTLTYTSTVVSAAVVSTLSEVVEVIFDGADISPSSQRSPIALIDHEVLVESFSRAMLKGYMIMKPDRCSPRKAAKHKKALRLMRMWPDASKCAIQTLLERLRAARNRTYLDSNHLAYLEMLLQQLQ